MELPYEQKQEPELERELVKLLREGSGETIYEISAPDMDMDERLKTIKTIAGRLHSDVSIIRRKAEKMDILIRKINYGIETRVAVVGNVDAGKSSLLGVLTHNLLDDGRGLARSCIFRHKHEIASGRTSSICHEVLAFDSIGGVIPYVKSSMDKDDISKMIHFIDLAGHRKYFGTTMYGMTGHHPDYAMLIVGSNMGIIGTTKEHLGVSLALQIPVFVVITKVDMCPENVLKETITQLKSILKSRGCRKIPFLVHNEDDMIVCARNFVSERITPIFCVSNISGKNIDLLKKFMNLLPTTRKWEDTYPLPLEMQIDTTWYVNGFGTVVSGTIMKGTINVSDSVLMGPTTNGQFVPVAFKSLYCKDCPATSAHAGQCVSVSLKKVSRKDVVPGMVIISPKYNPVPCMEFNAEIIILCHATTIMVGYESVVHCGGIQQTVRIVAMDKDVLRAGDRANVRFRFIFKPEYIVVGSRIMLREGNARGIGQITGGSAAPPMTPLQGVGCAGAVNP
jgi:GTPase